jgi:hypothetical protein
VGAAGFWWPDVAEAIQLALEGGINLHNDSRFRVSVSIDSLHHIRQPSVPLVNIPMAVRTARIRLISPLRIRNAGSEQFSAASFLISLANRVSAMARWQRLKLVVDWPAIHELAWQAEIANEQMTPVYWQRGSMRKAKLGRIPVLGYVGTVSISGNLTPIAPLLRIAEHINTGSHAALGFGRVSIAFYP